VRAAGRRVGRPDVTTGPRAIYADRDAVCYAANARNRERCGPTVIRRPPAWPATGEKGEATAPAAADQDAVRLIVGRFSQQLEPTARLMVGRYCDAIADDRLADADFLDRAAGHGR
jgi:hypothetical protein